MGHKSARGDVMTKVHTIVIIHARLQNNNNNKPVRTSSVD